MKTSTSAQSTKSRKLRLLLIALAGIALAFILAAALMQSSSATLGTAEKPSAEDSSAPEAPSGPTPPEGTATPQATGAPDAGTETLPAEPPAVASTLEEAVDPPSENPEEVAELAEVSQPVSEPVELDETATLTKGLSAEVTDLEAVDGEAEGIGEVAGPAVRFTITLANNTDKPISTDSTVVNVEAGPDAIPALQLSGPGGTSFPNVIEPGESGSATLIFNLPPDLREDVRIYLNHQADLPIAAFTGAVPTPEEER